MAINRRAMLSSFRACDGIRVGTMMRFFGRPVCRAGILGQKTLTMTQRYSHLTPEHQRQAVERLVTRKRETASASGARSGTSELAVACVGDVTPEEKWWTGET
jgi:hypothetical protein